MKYKYLFYMLFAAICTLINLGSQFLLGTWLSGSTVLQYELFSFKIYFIIKLGTGTILGFLTKFILDKFIVFRNKHESTAATVKQIVIYGLFAVLTTVIFWSFEIGFRLLYKSETMDLAGGLIGLAIGYTVKFFLDKKFVFNSK